MLTDGDLLICHTGIRRKFITESQVAECLKLHQINLARHKQISLSDIFLAKQYLTPSQLEILRKIIDKQGKNRLIDGYEILSLIGQGAMGNVFKARQMSMDRIVALKILPFELSSDVVFIKRFMLEARASGKLNHPNIIQGYDVGQCHGVYYFAMEFVEGQNVGQLLKTKERFTEKEALEIIVQVVNALEHAWEYGIVHRDIKPENIMITPKGIAKLGDLGLARANHNTKRELTVPGAIIGTPLYISPEQATGQKDIDIRSDIYSLGLTLFKMVTGKPPFDAASASIIIAKHITQDLPNPSTLCPDLSAEFCRIIQKMARKNREERYQTPTLLKQDITNLLEELQKGSTAPRRPTAGSTPSQQSLAVLKNANFKFSYVPSEREVYFGLIALKNKILTREQLKTALAIQEHDAERGIIESLDRILVRRGDLSEKYRDLIMEAQLKAERQEQDQQFVEIARNTGLVIRHQIEQALRLQELMLKANRYEAIDEILMRKGFLSRETHERIMRELERKKREREDLQFARVAVKVQWLSLKQIEQVRKSQPNAAKTGQAKLAHLLVCAGLLQEDQTNALMRAQRLHEMLGDPVAVFLRQQLVADDSAEEEEAGDLRGIFDGIKLKTSPLDSCPYCGSEIHAAHARCPHCHKHLF